MTAAGVIFKFQNPTKYPSLESSENRADASKVVEKARTLYQIDIHSQIEPHAPSEPYPEPSLYPDLSAMAQELGYFYNVEESAISFLPSAPPMEA
jgi:hypothetical protein